jgi:hypothetical protein
MPTNSYSARYQRQPSPFSLGWTEFSECRAVGKAFRSKISPTTVSGYGTPTRPWWSSRIRIIGK